MSNDNAPIDREWIVAATPWLRGALGLAFVAYSAAATIRMGGADLAPALGDVITIGYIQDRYWYSAGVALLLFLGQVATRGRWPAIYGLFLFPDVIYTARQAQEDISAYLQAEHSLEGLGLLLASWGLAGVIGFFVARWGEELLFGKPKPKRRRAAAKES